MWLIIVFVFLATVYSWVPQDVLKKEKKKPWPEPLHGFVSFPWNLYTSSGKQETGEVIYWTTETCTEIESIKQNKKFVYNSNKLEKKKKKKNISIFGMTKWSFWAKSLIGHELGTGCWLLGLLQFLSLLCSLFHCMCISSQRKYRAHKRKTELVAIANRKCLQTDLSFS